MSRLNFEYPGPSWKYPNKQANEFEIDDIQKFEYSENTQENVLIQMGLLEILVDRLHFLLLSSTETKAEKFVSIGRASRILISKLIMLHEGAQEKKSNISDMRNLINQTVKDSNNLFYSPNYEEDLRREMFPIVDNLVLAVAAICDKNGIPSSSCELWEGQKGKIDKKTFVRITTNIRKDMERISKLFEKMEKRTKALNVQVEEKKREIKAIEASREGLKATMKRKEHEAETRFEDMRSQMQYKLDIAQSDTLKVNERLSATLKEVECKSEEFKKARKSLEDLRRTSEIHMAD
jgi:hypothetical protein